MTAARLATLLRMKYGQQKTKNTPSRRHFGASRKILPEPPCAGNVNLLFHKIFQPKIVPSIGVE
jgi:hypothetical protein